MHLEEIRVIRDILRHHELLERPPVLVDVGASGGSHRIWDQLAPFSIVVGFDADLRDTEFVVREGKGFKKLFLLNKLIGASKSTVPFHLTTSPHCSSTLEPDLEALSPYHFKSLFHVEKTVLLQAIDLKSALASVDISYVDWLKTDTQGTDLTVVKSLGEDLIASMIVAEFEPGISSAYKREDKMHSVMSFMDTLDFWLCDLALKGPCRLSEDAVRLHFGNIINQLEQVHKTVPFWGEMTYLHGFSNRCSKRDILLGCAFGIILQQFGFVLELAQKGNKLHKDELFGKIIRFSIQQINRKITWYIRLKALCSPLITILRKMKKRFMKRI